MSNIIQRIRTWWCGPRITLGPGDAAIVMKSNGEEKLYMPPVPEAPFCIVTKAEGGVEADLNAPMFKVMLFCWVNAEEQEHVRDEFIEFLEEEEDDS